jgi:hypothetical protein
MSKYLLLFSFLCTIVLHPGLIAASSTPLVSLLIEVPNGTTQHGNPRIICPPTTWATLATFFVGNFVAHIVTVKSIPGERLPVTICNLILALLFPTSGLMRGLNAIARLVRLGESEIDKACRAGALCVVVRNSKWRPRPGDNIQVVLATREPSGPQGEKGAGDNTLPSDDEDDEEGNIVKRELSISIPILTQLTSPQLLPSRSTIQHG